MITELEITRFDTLDSRVAEGELFDNDPYTYDTNGSLTDKRDKSTLETTTYTYNAENQLTRIDFPDGSSAEYKYDGLGRRIQKDVNGAITKYIYDNEDILLEYNGANTLQAKYTHGPGIDEPVSMERNNQSYYYHPDGLGSITTLTNSAGNVTQSYLYDSFGNIVETTGSLINPYTYTGREYDQESELYYYRARYYEPITGRFLQEDPVWNINLYPYAGNNSVNWIDPWGLSIEEPKQIPWWQPTPQRSLRWSGRALQEAGRRGLGKSLGLAGLVLEPGGTGKITGIVAGGAAGAKVGSVIGGAIGSVFPGPGTVIGAGVGGVVGGIGGGIVGGKIGSSFDSPYAGELY